MSVIARVRSNGVRTKFPNFSVYRMSVVNDLMRFGHYYMNKKPGNTPQVSPITATP